MKKQLTTWLGTALWTAVGASITVAIDGPYNHPATDSDTPAWVVAWLTLIGIPTWLALGARPNALDKASPTARPSGNAVGFVVANTVLFVMLFWMILLANAGPMSWG